MLWELWRRLPPADVTVLTTAHPDAPAFDADQPFRVERAHQRVLWPARSLTHRIHALAAEVRAELIVLDPAIPLGILGPRLRLPYVVMLHGSELLGRLPLGSRLMGSSVRGAVHVIAAGGYPAAEAVRVAGAAATPPVTIVPPGVDSERFHPLDDGARADARLGLGLPADGPLVVGLSRLVPRKGFDVLIDAASALATRYPGLTVAIGGSGRDRERLERRASRLNAPVVFLGRVSDADLPAVYAVADVFVMPCRGNRWLGLEQEGFGAVFVEAAASGVPQVAGRSGGSADAVSDGVTGVVVGSPRDAAAVASAIDSVLADPNWRSSLAAASRERAVNEFAYDVLAARLAAALEVAAAH